MIWLLEVASAAIWAVGLAVVVGWSVRVGTSVLRELARRPVPARPLNDPPSHCRVLSRGHIS